MPPSGKIAGPFSTALTAVAVLGIVAFFASKDPLWPPAIAELAARTASIWFKPSEGRNRASEQAASHDGTTPGPGKASPEMEDGQEPSRPEAAFLVPPLSWSHLQIEAALMECLNVLAPIDAEIVPLAPLAYGGCGTPAPVLLRSLGAKDKVTLDPPLLVNCPIVAALNRWLERKVQPAARAAFGSPVTKIMASSYACRTPYNLPNDRLSQHAFANAVDLSIFVLADGRTISVTNGWGPAKRDLVAAAKPKLVPVVAKDGEPDQATKGEAAKKEPARAKSDDAEAAVVVKASATEKLDATKPEAAPVKPKPEPVPDPLATPQAKFLRQARQGACEIFSTVLGPEANDVHRTHFHLDLQERNALKVCQ
jgi:hypothetical protein